MIVQLYCMIVYNIYYMEMFNFYIQYIQSSVKNFYIKEWSLTISKPKTKMMDNFFELVQ